MDKGGLEFSMLNLKHASTVLITRGWIRCILSITGPLDRFKGSKVEIVWWRNRLQRNSTVKHKKKLFDKNKGLLIYRLFLIDSLVLDRINKCRIFKLKWARTTHLFSFDVPNSTRSIRLWQRWAVFRGGCAGCDLVWPMSNARRFPWSSRL